MLIAELSYRVKFDELSPEAWREFSDIWLLEKGTKQEHFYFSSAQRQRITMEQALRLQEIGVEVDLKGVDGTMLTKLRDQQKDWKYGDRVTAADLVSGAAVQITLPDVGLLVIDEVTWREDECTEEIQRMLDDGWRIIAVCPPNAQRRPDYILGRRKHKDNQ